MPNPQQLITENLNIWTAAIKKRGSQGRGSSKKIELHGIKKLRELILELAVRGLLVPQDPNDEPASVLLEKIAAEKAQLIKDKKIKKQKPMPEISEDEKPFELPKGWKWVYFQDISEYIQRGKGPKYSENGSVRVVSQKCVQASGFDLTPARFVEDESLEKYQPERFLKDNDLLWNSTGTGTVGRINVITGFEHGSLVADSHVTVIRTLMMDTRFIWSFISAPGVQSRIEPTHENALVSGSTKQVELNTSSVTSLLIPVPPEAEQPRIVAKVDELMALCDQLEQQTEASLTAHQTLVETLLNSLLDAAQAYPGHASGLSDDTNLDLKADIQNHKNKTKGDPFQQAWQRIWEHFDVLFTTEHSIDQLKQTILQLAVMGKLVPQDPNDEPASVLLEKIAAEKEQLIKDKKIKKQKPVEPIGDIQVLPNSWVDIVVQDFADIRLGSTPNRAETKYWNGDIPWVSSGEVAFGVIEDTTEKITQLGFENSSTAIIPARSLLMAIIGQGKTRGQTAILGVDACTNQNVAAFVFNESYVVTEFVSIWAQSKYDSHRGDGHGGAQPALNGKKVRSFRFPLPPHEEQHRIISKVDELMALCDSLKERIRESQTTQLHLADAMAEQALN